MTGSDIQTAVHPAEVVGIEQMYRLSLDLGAGFVDGF